MLFMRCKRTRMEIKGLCTDRDKRYELFLPADPKMLEMVLFIFRKSWWMLEEIIGPGEMIWTRWTLKS